VNDGKPAWWIASSAMKPNAEADVGQRPIPYEPMYLIINLGLSENFGAIESVAKSDVSWLKPFTDSILIPTRSYEGLERIWPVHMLIDYIRVYQDPKVKDLGCDPEDMPTAKYIETYKAAYTYVFHKGHRNVQLLIYSPRLDITATPTFRHSTRSRSLTHRSPRTDSQ